MATSSSAPMTSPPMRSSSWTGPTLRSAGGHTLPRAATCYTCVQVAPLTTDVIHVLFTCCDTDIATNMTEALNSYYDYLKVILQLCNAVNSIEKFRWHLHVHTTATRA